MFWEICVLAMVLGFNNCFETPARQAFMLEMVGSSHVRNAVSLKLHNGERGASRRSGGRRVLIATVGVGLCS